MDNFTTEQWRLVVAVAAIISFAFGRISGRRGAGAGGGNRSAMDRMNSAEDAFAGLSPDIQTDVDRLLHDRKTIEAIKRIREASGLGLKDSKDVADWRRSQLKG